MKKKILFLLGGVVLGGLFSLNVSAQTDVTSTYLTNAGFEGESFRFLNINSDRGVEKPAGWSVEWTQAGKGQNGMTFIGSMTQDNKTWSAHEGDKAYFTRMRWESATLNLRQTMTNLRPGSYTLSFYATAYSSTSGATGGTASVSVAGQSQSITVSGNAEMDWKEYAINFTITASTPYATIEVTAARTADNFKFGIDDFTLTYDGSSYYETILAAAQSLYNDNKDWAENADGLSTAITGASGKETVADKNAAIFSLETAMKEFKDANTIDVTDRIINATFDSDINDWTVTGGDGNDYQWNNSSQNNFTGGFLEKWRNGWTGAYNQKNFDVSQTLSGLPNGEYTVKVAIIAVMQGAAETFDSNTTYSNKKHGGPYYIDDEKGVWLYGRSGENTGKAWANTKNGAFDGDGAEYKIATVKVENGSLTIGFKGVGSESGGTSLGTYANWIACDNWTLSYFGFDPSALKSQISNLKSDVQALIDGNEVPTAVKTSLQIILDNLVETPETKSVLEAAISTLQNAIVSANGIKSDYGEYKALKAIVEDLKNTSKYTFTGDDALSTFNSTLSTIDGDAEAATDAATLTALLPSLKTAGNTFVGGIESTDGFDLTYNIDNNSFETGVLSPWTTNGSNDTGVRENSNGTYTTTGVDGDYLFNTWNDGKGSKVSQNLSGLPKGYYTVTALVASDAGNKINILAGASTKEVESDANDGKNKFVEGTTDKTLVSDGSLEIGTNSSKWYKADYFRLTYYTEKAGAAEAWTAAKDAAEDAIANSDYANVTGSEKAELEAEIAKAEPTTADAYGTATTALQTATSTFIAAKDSYDGLAAANASVGTLPTLAYADAAKKPVASGAATSAEDAVNKTAAVLTAVRAYYESHAKAEGVSGAQDYTSAVSDANADTNTGWTNGVGTNSGQGYTDAAGTVSTKYLDGGWSGSAGVNIDMTRSVAIPAGKYLLTVTARGSTQLNTYTLSIGGETVNLPKNGNTGGVFNNGWDDVSVEFDADGTTQTLEVTASSTEYQQWISINRFRLVCLEINNDAYVGTTEYAALNEAISAAEAKTLGFGNGEYAPYNNVAALEALVAAKAIDQTAELTNLKTVVQAATTALSGATWAANTADVDAIYNGSFSSNVEGDWGLTGWTRTNAWGQQQTGLSGAYATAYYNQPGSLQYGNQGVYTMPLAADTYYKLTVSYRSHENNSNNGVTVSVLNDNNEGLSAKTLAANGSTSEWATKSVKFKTGAAGNYVLTLANSGNTWMTNVSLVKTVPDKVTMKITSVKWATFIAPFDVTIPSGVTAYTVTGVNNGVLGTSEVATTIPANTPVLLNSETTVNQEFEGASREDEYSPATSGLIGVYSSALAPTDSYVLMESGGEAVFGLVVDGDQPTVGANRCYLTLPAPSPASVLRIGGATNISNVESTEDGATVYDLTGRRVDAPAKGIYIVNGKKVLVK